ncbi:MAG: hypothetical protein ACOX63_09535 [Christensenellales bacterium]
MAISLERYEKLIESETRLGMLRKMRFIEVTNNNSTYIQSEDHILGGMVLEALLANQEKEKQKNKEPNDE